MRLFLPALLSLCLACALAGCKRSQPSANGAANANTQSGGIVSSEAQSEAQRLLNEGNELYKNDQDEQAIEAYKKAVSLDPNNGEAYFRLGLAYSSTGKKDEAAEAFKKSVE